MGQLTGKTRQVAERATSSRSQTGRGSAEDHPIVRLQRAVGNQGVLPLLEPRGLEIERSGGGGEHEAETMADRWTAAPPAGQDRTAGGEAACGRQSLPTASPLGTLGEGGRPLAESDRSYFEPRLGRDLSRVRVYAGEGPATWADALSATAFTWGSDIVFGREAPRPSTPAGRHLLAHELGHFVQQAERGTSTIQRQAPAGSSPSRTGYLDLVDGTVQMLQAAAEHYETLERLRRFDATRATRGGSQVHAIRPPPDPGRALAAWKSAVDHGIRLIRDHLGGDTIRLQHLESAYRAAVTGLLEHAHASEGGATPATRRRYLDQLHEWAWPLSIAVGAPGALMGSLPEAALRRIRVVDRPVLVPTDLADLFATRGTRTTIQLPPRSTVEFSANVPPRLQHGLGNIAGHLTASTPPSLEVNSTVTLSLDLTGVGADLSAWSFTFVEAESRATLSQRILIEPLGTVGAESPPPSVLERGRELLRRHHLRPRGWSSSEHADLLVALTLVPEPHLASVDGLTFTRRGAALSEAHLRSQDRMIGGDYASTVTMCASTMLPGGCPDAGKSGRGPASPASGRAC